MTPKIRLVAANAKVVAHVRPSANPPGALPAIAIKAARLHALNQRASEVIARLIDNVIGNLLAKFPEWNRPVPISAKATATPLRAVGLQPSTPQKKQPPLPPIALKAARLYAINTGAASVIENVIDGNLARLETADEW